MIYKGYKIKAVRGKDGKYRALVIKDGKEIYTADYSYNSKGYALADGLKQAADLVDYR